MQHVPGVLYRGQIDILRIHAIRTLTIRAARSLMQNKTGSSRTEIESQPLEFAIGRPRVRSRAKINDRSRREHIGWIREQRGNPSARAFSPVHIIIRRAYRNFRGRMDEDGEGEVGDKLNFHLS